MSKLCFIHFSEHINVSIKTIVLQCIISMYAIMHDKDFVYQLLSSGSCLKVTTWQIMAVVSNRKFRLKKKHKVIINEIHGVIEEIGKKYS